jgi:nucleoside-diphosphate-sugar epimerase
MNLPTLYIVGCGDIGTRVAKIAADRKTKVCSLSRGNKFPPRTDTSGVAFKVCDLDTPETLSGLNLKGAALLYSAPPPGGGVLDTRVRNFLATLQAGCEPAKIVYISTTSVYGDCRDELVTEERPVNPANHTAKRRCDAEERFRAWGAERGVPIVILRVSGIYGPGRIPMQRIQSQEPLLDEREVGYTNRIHSDDLAQVCLAALEKGADGDIFNVCDGEESKMTDYFNAITDLMHLPRLPQVSLAEARKVMSPLMFSYMTESRKISNRKMIEKLGIKLKYPTMMEGLKDSL